MLKNYFKIATRNLYKNKLFTSVNVFGLAFGFTCSILMLFWVWDEMAYDRFHTNEENIYQIFGEYNTASESIVTQYAPSSIAEPILDRLPEVSKIGRVFPYSEVVFSTDQGEFSEKGIYADPSILSIFNFPLREGKLKNILSGANSVVISSKLAEKYFPGQSALGKYIDIVYKEKVSYVITGVLEEIPVQSSLQFDYVISYQSFEDEHRPWWKATNEYSFNNFNVNVYAELVPDANILEFNNKLNTFISDYTEEQSDNSMFAYPFTEVYLHSDFSEGRTPTGKIQYVRLISIIAIIVFLIACINFINLSTAMAGKRAKEVGLRKVVGAKKPQIIVQFLVESILIAMVSMTIAVMFVEMLLPLFNFITQKQIVAPINSPLFVLLILGVSIGTGVLAGSYPAFVLSAFEPSKTLKNSNSSSVGLSGMRKALVVTQFTLAMVFMVYTLLVYNQISFIQDKDLGIRKDNIVRHELKSIRGKTESYKAELLTIQGVQSVSFTEQSPYNISNANLGVSWQGKPDDAEIFINVLQASDDFVETFGLKLLEGKPFPENYTIDNEKHFIINEAAAKAMMLDDPIGAELVVWGKQGKVAGMVKDYHHRSLDQSIEPLVVIYIPEETWSAYISLNTDNTTEALNNIQAVYSKFENDYPFDYYFVDEQYKTTYKDVITVGKLSYMFSIAAILISCLGLFGLSAFITEQRTKETGIRKVLGASDLSLLYLFSREFTKLVLISFAIASPIAWIYSKQWLSDYAYHVEIGLLPFFIAGASTLIIALLTVGYNTMRAANANPVDSLKYE